VFCSKCGNQVKRDATFCASCGAPIDRLGDSISTETPPVTHSVNPPHPPKSVENSPQKKGKSDSSSGFLSFTKKRLSLILIGVSIILVVIFVFIPAIQYYTGFLSKPVIENNTTINVANLQNQILSIGELATMEYGYRTLITMKDSRSIKGWNIPFTQKSFILVVDGTMKIGIDTSDIQIVASEMAKTITLTVPEAKILSHELHEETLEVLEESSGLFNRISIEDWSTMAVAEKQAMEEKISEGDLFSRAQSDAATILRSLLIGVVPEDYTITVS